MRANGFYRASNPAGNHRLRLLMVVIALTMALIVPSSLANAKNGGAQPGGEEAGNNLSVPTYFVPDRSGAPTLRVDCRQDPDGPTMKWDGLDYYMQKSEATWSAPCSNRERASVRATWGSNLINDRTLRAGRPIRVEMQLTHTSDRAPGYIIENLTPSLPDRRASYGTLGIPDGVEDMAYMVWAADAQLTIETVPPGVRPVYDGPMSAEINSTGKVVYGHNWGIAKTDAPEPGRYKLVFTIPSTNGTVITGADDEGEPNVRFTEKTATVGIYVGPAGGGGQGGNQ